MKIRDSGMPTGIIHWRSDIPTPRGPALAIRPTPQTMLNWVEQHPFSIHKPPSTLKPYHFGLVITKQ